MGFRTTIENRIKQALDESPLLQKMGIHTRPESKGGDEVDQMKKEARKTIHGNVYVSCMTRQFSLVKDSRVLQTKPGVLVVVLRKNKNMTIGYKETDDIMDEIIDIMYEIGYNPVQDFIDPSPSTGGLRVGLMYFSYKNIFRYPE